MVVAIREAFKELFSHNGQTYEYKVRLGYHEEDGYQGNLDFTRIKEIATTITKKLLINNLYVTIIHEPRGMRWRLLFEFTGIKNISVVNLVSYQELYNYYVLGQSSRIIYHYIGRVKSFFDAQFRSYPQVWRLYPGQNILEVELPNQTRRVEVRDIKCVMTQDLSFTNFEIIIENQNRINKHEGKLFLEDIPLQCDILRAFNFSHSVLDEAWLVMPRVRNIEANRNNSFTLYMNIETAPQSSTSEITRYVENELTNQLIAFGIPEEMLFSHNGEENRIIGERERISLMQVYGQPIIIGIDSANRVESVSNVLGDEDYIGDITCLNNARSKYLRCAINPSGPCENCKDNNRRPEVD